MTAANGVPADIAAYRDLWRAAQADVAGRHDVALREVAGGVCLGCAAPLARGGFALVCLEGLAFAADAIKRARLA